MPSNEAPGAGRAPADACAADRARLQRVLSAAPVAEVRGRDDGVNAQAQAHALTPAAVLVPLVRREDGFNVLLTQRADNLRDHPGQISFPGGSIEPDDGSPQHAALREAHEEIGLPPGNVDVIGYLPDYCTITGYRVTPVVAIVTPPFELTLDAGEVAHAFEVPFCFLMNPANHQQHTMLRDGVPRRFHAIPYGEYFIWGATAGILMSLYQALVG